MPIQLKIRRRIKVELQPLFDLMLKAETNNNKSIMTLMHFQTLENVSDATNQAHLSNNCLNRQSVNFAEEGGNDEEWVLE